MCGNVDQLMWNGIKFSVCAWKLEEAEQKDEEMPGIHCALPMEG